MHYQLTNKKTQYSIMVDYDDCTDSPLDWGNNYKLIRNQESELVIGDISKKELIDYKQDYKYVIPLRMEDWRSQGHRIFKSDWETANAIIASDSIKTDYLEDEIEPLDCWASGNVYIITATKETRCKECKEWRQTEHDAIGGIYIYNNQDFMQEVENTAKEYFDFLPENLNLNEYQELAH